MTDLGWALYNKGNERYIWQWESHSRGASVDILDKEKEEKHWVTSRIDGRGYHGRGH